MDRFPALRLILRLGRIGAAIVAVVVALLATVLTWNSLGWFAVAHAPFVFAFAYLVIKSYVEIIQIITEMVH